VIIFCDCLSLTHKSSYYYYLGSEFEKGEIRQTEPSLLLLAEWFWKWCFPVRSMSFVEEISAFKPRSRASSDRDKAGTSKYACNC